MIAVLMDVFVQVYLLNDISITRRGIVQLEVPFNEVLVAAARAV
jgi:hypothetical protein